MKTCCFFGHKNIFACDLRTLLDKKVEELIIGGYRVFLFGGYGQFDNLCYSVIKNLKEKYKHIKMIYVQAYYKPHDDCWEQFKKGYDEVIFPEINAPKQFAILKRNQIMIDISDLCIFYVNQTYGGAYQALQCAKRKGKNFFNFGVNGSK